MDAKYVIMWDPSNYEDNQLLAILRPYGDLNAIDALDVKNDTQEDRNGALFYLCALHSINPCDVIDECDNGNDDLG